MTEKRGMKSIFKKKILKRDKLEKFSRFDDGGFSVDFHTTESISRENFSTSLHNEMNCK